MDNHGPSVWYKEYDVTVIGGYPIKVLATYM